MKAMNSPNEEPISPYRTLPSTERILPRLALLFLATSIEHGPNSLSLLGIGIIWVSAQSLDIVFIPFVTDTTNRLGQAFTPPIQDESVRSEIQRNPLIEHSTQNGNPVYV